MSAWVPILAGGVGGAVLTNLAAEWRQWRSNRREDRVRFDADRLIAASEVSRLSSDAQRLQLRRMAIRSRDPVDREILNDLDARYRTVAEALSGAGARFRLLYPSEQRKALGRLLDALDTVTAVGSSKARADAGPIASPSIQINDAAKAALDAARRLDLAFVESCRRYLVGMTDEVSDGN